MKIFGITVIALTAASFFLFIVSYRARAVLRKRAGFSQAGSSQAWYFEGDVAAWTRASGLYVVEILTIAAFCYLASLSLYACGLAGRTLWIASCGAAAASSLLLVPLFVKSGIPKEGVGSRASHVALERAGRLFSFLGGSRREPEDVGTAPALPESEHAREVLRLLLRLRERRVSEVMVSRIDMVCAQESSTILEVADLVKEVAFTRIPVFSGTIDSITGYVTAKDVVIRLHQGGGAEPVSSIARKAAFVSSSATIEHALEQMQSARATLVIVTSPEGKTSGLVAGEDILEEVVGDLYGDRQVEEPAYQVIDDRTAIVRANVALSDLKEIFGVAPSGNLNQTLGNYVRKELGAEVSKGERVSDAVFSYQVARTIGKLIWSLRVERRN